MKIGIIGCGLSGILLSYLLNKEEITIYEKENFIGGLCCSKTNNGFTYDLGGSHILFSRNKEILDRILKLLGDNFVSNRRNTKIFYHNILVKYPFENGLGDLPPDAKFECLMGYINAYILRQKDTTKSPGNFSEWLEWKFGNGMKKHYLEPYNKKLWKIPLEDLDCFWVKNRVPDPKIEDLIKAALKMESEGYQHQINFFYPKEGGIQSLINALKARIGSKTEILLEQKINSIYNEDGKWIINSNYKKREFDLLISTIPIPELLAVLDDIPDIILEISKKLKTISLINVFFGIKGQINPKFVDLSWLYIPNQKDSLSHRISFISNYSASNSPENHSSVNLEITTHYNSEIWNMENETLYEQLINDIIRMGIIDKKSQIIYHDMAKWKYAYVIYDLTYQEIICKIKDYLHEIGLIPFGRFGLYEYLNIDQIFIKAFEFIEELKRKNLCLK